MTFRPIVATAFALAWMSFSGPALSAEYRIADGGAMWCQHYYSLGPFIAAFLHHGAIAYDEFPACARFNAGLRVDIVEDAPDIAGRSWPSGSQA